MASTFSIITVSKDNFNGINGTLESIKNLTSNNFEWIPVISGNCNKTLNLLKENHSFKINPIINRDKNLWDAMNLGIEKSVNEYLIFMNAGDKFYNKNILLKISDFIIDNKHPDLIYGNTIEEIEKNKKKYKRSLNHKFIEYGMFASHQSIFYKKNLFSDCNLKYDFENYPYAADYALTAQIIKTKTNIKFINEYISIFLTQGMSFSDEFLLEGRKEQMKIKQKILKLNLFKIYFYFLIQLFIWNVRKRFSKLYELIRYK